MNTVCSLPFQWVATSGGRPFTVILTVGEAPPSALSIPEVPGIPPGSPCRKLGESVIIKVSSLPYTLNMVSACTCPTETLTGYVPATSGWPLIVAGTVKPPENVPCGEVVIVCARVISALPNVMPVMLALVGKLEPLKDTLVPAVPVFGLIENIGMP